MALTPQERAYLQELLAKEARQESGEAAMQEIIDAMNNNASDRLPSKWQVRNSEEDN